jgi:hypothetical protein
VHVFAGVSGVSKGAVAGIAVSSRFSGAVASDVEVKVKVEGREVQ